MRKLIGGVFQSLDGVMQAPGGPDEDTTGGFKLGGWSTSFWDDQMNKAMERFFKVPYDLLLGRRTYDLFANHWGVLGESDPLGAAFLKARKYVMTRGSQPLDWKNSERVHNVEALKNVKAGMGPDIVIQGSSSLYPALFKAGLIDKLFVMTFPVVLGNGKRLFGEGTPPFKMKMVSSESASSGVVMAMYEPAGEVPIGNFKLPNPSPGEIERQRQMRAGIW
ncbi:MAG: dihydrofolate reductase family protein [Bdellovibrionota bacterium]